jgi:hypothetical protein
VSNAKIRGNDASMPLHKYSPYVSQMPISNPFHKGTSAMSSFRKVVKNPSLKPILVRIGKKFAETIILSIIPRFCNPCTALTVPFAIAWLKLVVHHPMNSGIPFHKQHIIYSDRNL